MTRQRERSGGPDATTSRRVPRRNRRGAARLPHREGAPPPGAAGGSGLSTWGPAAAPWRCYPANGYIVTRRRNTWAMRALGWLLRGDSHAGDHHLVVPQTPRLA